MQDPNEQHIDDEITPETEVVEVEPDEEYMDRMIPVIDLITITKEDLRRLLENIIPQA